MSLLRIESIKRKYNISYVLIGQALFIVFLGMILTAIFDSRSGRTPTQLIILSVLVPIVGYFIYTTARMIAEHFWFHQREKKLVKHALSSGYALGIPYVSQTVLSFGYRDRRQLAFQKADICFVDHSYAVYHKTKNGEHKSYTVHYAVASIQLPRKLPHVFFDAMATSGKEYQVLFDDSQRHSLEGDFDRYFATYFPTHYTVDSLSFITPEVMQMLISYKNYDIEIEGDRLYVIAPFRQMPGQIMHMEQALRDLLQVLKNNILTYRDERVTGMEGRQDISLAGMRLRRGLAKEYVKLAVGMVFFAAFCAVSIADDDITYALYGLALGLSAFFPAVSAIRRENAFRKAADKVQRTFQQSRDS